jgi:hypothetical protein
MTMPPADPFSTVSSSVMPSGNAATASTVSDGSFDWQPEIATTRLAIKIDILVNCMF